MKRIDVVLKIKALLDNLEGITTNRIKSEVILGELEALGMTPPSTKRLRKFNEFFSVLEDAKEWDME